MKQNDNHQISRRDALRILGTGALGLAVASSGLNHLSAQTKDNNPAKVTYRSHKGTANKISLLGFGCMRYPLKADKTIDEALAQKMIDYAYAHGVNYYDTAYPYHRGASEAFTGKALKKYPRNSFYLADKMPTWLIDSSQKAKEIFDSQLERCQVEYFDYYLLHALEKEEDYKKVYLEYGVLDYLKEEKKAGRIKQLGFSFHGKPEFFDYLLEQYPWDFVQIQLNYYDWDGDNAKYLYNKLEEKNIPCIIMEPVRGGMLAKLNPDAEAVLKEAHPDKTIASWAMRYVASLPGVLTVLSGMTAMDHVIDNVATLSTDFKPLDNDERKVLDKALQIFLKTRPILCTSCKYCMPCKFGVDIPGNFMVYNKCVNESTIPEVGSQTPAEFAKRREIFLKAYNEIPVEARADKCMNCKKCERVCPQHLPITSELERIAKLTESLK
ncbi:MAG: aldo/keto reductase [Bacteroidales bacterium]|nr:aldo/keto reductase [Bacteroidales bacterium]MDD4670100.1 aldo/keto reductase [Bacteroidales bacterium]